MAEWKIYPLLYGVIDVTKDQFTTGLDVGMPITIPYLGFYMADGKHKVLCDTGINAKYIVDGKAWAGCPAQGGEAWVLKSLREIDVDPKEIELVLYTHLHNDHAGNCHLFSNATHMFQEAEWKELLDPLPSMMIRGDFDQSLIPQLKELKCMKVVGDLQILEGLEIILTPGHTAGSICVLVQTSEGVYNITGDTIHVLPIVFPEMTEWAMMDGKQISITPAPKHWGPAVPSSLVYDHYAWFRSMYRIQSMFREPRFYLPGHETSIVGKRFG
ncbi:MAG: N-acyl homoserine lactonase family protein [Methanosarcinaceae archaeon]|nr:N-acyl homoserine lactonase family protein [Methanosarcinaceae archaeon]